MAFFLFVLLCFFNNSSALCFSSCSYAMSYLNRKGLFDRVWKAVLCQDVCKWVHRCAHAQPCPKVWWPRLWRFSQLGEDEEGKWIGGAQRHFCKLRGVLLMHADYCSVVMAWMLKLLDAVPSSVAAFWCSDAWVSWCLRASAVGVIEFLEVPWQHCRSADRWLRYDWHRELTAIMASLSVLLY